MMPSECWNPAHEISADELELRSHIRHLLLSYVQAYITTPYTQFTEGAVLDLLSNLKPIPVHDPTSLTLPTEPLAVYLSSFAGAVEPYVEKLQTTNEARLLIKRLLASKPPRAVNFADTEHEETYAYYRPSTPPILTRRAVRETPVIGKKFEPLRSYAAYTKTHALPPIPVQEVAEPQVNSDQILDVKHYIRAEDHVAVRSLLKLAAKSRAPAHIHAYLPSSLAGTPNAQQQPTPPPDSPPFMPIFPRRIPVRPPVRAKRKRDPHSRSAEPTKRCKLGSTLQSLPESMEDMPLLIEPMTINDNSRKVGVDMDDLDLYKENMVVVDGWQTFVTSSPSVLSSNSNEEDQLILPSSPDTDVGPIALVKAVEDSRLEDVLIPRSRKVGGKPFEGGTKSKDPGIGRLMRAGYGKFLVPLLQPEKARTDPATIPTTSRKPPSQTELEDAGSGSSLYGQASGPDLHSFPDRRDSDDTDIHQICAQMTSVSTNRGLKNIVGSREEPGGEYQLPVHPYNVIKDEPLFEDGDTGKDERNEESRSTSKEMAHGGHGGIGALIPVPNLPEPNTYAVSYNGATTLAECVASTGGSPNNAMNRSRGFLRKAKGIAALRVALSWVPFTLLSPGDPPTHAGVTGVARLFGDSPEEARCDDNAVQGLLKSAAVIEDTALGNNGGKCQGVSERLWSIFGDAYENEPTFVGDGEVLLRYGIILTREERLGIEIRKGGKTQADGLAQKEDGPDRTLVHNDTYNSHAKRKDIHGGKNFDDDIPQIKKKSRLLSSGEFDDSGIVMMDSAHGFADNTEAEGELLDFNAEYDEEREVSGYTYYTRVEDLSAVGGELFDMDGEKENLPPVHNFETGGGYTSNGTGIINDYPWTEDWQDTLGHTRCNDYSKGSSYDATPGAEVIFESNQHPQTGTIELLDTEFDRSKYIGWNEDYGLELLNDDQDYVGGSFESLPLSFDSQSYKAVSARSSQVRVLPGRLSMPNQLDSQARPLYANDSTNKLEANESQNTQANNDLITDFSTKTTDAHAPRIALTQSEPPPAFEELQLPPLGPLSDLSFVTHTLGSAAFAKLRGKVVEPNNSTNPGYNSDPQAKSTSKVAPQVPRDPPVGLHDHRTFCQPSGLRPPPSTTHKYLASLDLLQKQALVRALRTPEHQIDLVERVALGGADLILDIHAALIFVPLLSLPAQTQAEALLARVSYLSWAFERLLVVFEAYPASRSVRNARSSSSVVVSPFVSIISTSDSISASSASPVPRHLGAYTDPEPGLYAYTPPVMKAIRKFRRDLDIAEACGTKSGACLVEYAFADSVNDAASFARIFGDALEAEASRDLGGYQGPGGQQGVLWGDRAWLDCGPDEGEDELSVVPGMNHFKAAAVLSQIALGDLLDLHPEERIEMFGGIIGVRSVMALNNQIEQRSRALEGYEVNPGQETE